MTKLNYLNNSLVRLLSYSFGSGWNWFIFKVNKKKYKIYHNFYQLLNDIKDRVKTNSILSVYIDFSSKYIIDGKKYMFFFCLKSFEFLSRYPFYSKAILVKKLTCIGVLILKFIKKNIIAESKQIKVSNTSNLLYLFKIFIQDQNINIYGKLYSLLKSIIPFITINCRKSLSLKDIYTIKVIKKELMQFYWINGLIFNNLIISKKKEAKFTMVTILNKNWWNSIEIKCLNKLKKNELKLSAINSSFNKSMFIINELKKLGITCLVLSCSISETLLSVFNYYGFLILDIKSISNIKDIVSLLGIYKNNNNINNINKFKPLYYSVIKKIYNKIIEKKTYTFLEQYREISHKLTIVIGSYNNFTYKAIKFLLFKLLSQLNSFFIDSRLLKGGGVIELQLALSIILHSNKTFITKVMTFEFSKIFRKLALMIFSNNSKIISIKQPLDIFIQKKNCFKYPFIKDIFLQKWNTLFYSIKVLNECFFYR